MHAYAMDGLIKELGLKDSDRNLLEGHIEYREAEPGITILREGCADVRFFDELFLYFAKLNNFLRFRMFVCYTF